MCIAASTSRQAGRGSCPDPADAAAAAAAVHKFAAAAPGPLVVPLEADVTERAVILVGAAISSSSNRFCVAAVTIVL